MLLVGCNETIDARQLREMNGLIYKVGQNEPFSGTAMSFPQYDRFTKYERWNCEVHFKKGELHGAYTCVSVDTGIKTNEKTFEHNFKTGLETIWNPKGKLISKTEWEGGRLNGVEELYHPITGKLLQQTHWLNDKKEGEEKTWDIKGDILLYDMMWRNGNKTGFSRQGSMEEEYKEGQLHGYRRSYYLQPGDYLQEQAAKTEIHLAQAGTYSYTLFQGVRLGWEELYESGKLISRTENNSSAPSEENTPEPVKSPDENMSESFIK